MTDRLRVAVTVPLSKEAAERLRKNNDRIELDYRPELSSEQQSVSDFVGDPDFKRTPEQQAEFDRMLDEADAFLGVPDSSGTALREAIERREKPLRWVHTMPAGGGAQIKSAKLDDDALENIVFTTSAGVHGHPLAEFALFGLMCGFKNLPKLQNDQKNHQWAYRWEMRQFSDMTILVVGLGGIGSTFAEKAKALGARIIGTSRHETEAPNVDEIIQPSDIASVGDRVDGIVVTLPGTEKTHHLVGEEFFASLTRKPVIVNVGRGTAIDEKAMTAAIENGTISYAALDVFENEPLEASSPLWDNEHVLISPHTSALTRAEETRIIDLFSENANKLLDGETLKNVVDTVEFY